MCSDDYICSSLDELFSCASVALAHLQGSCNICSPSVSASVRLLNANFNYM